MSKLKDIFSAYKIALKTLKTDKSVTLRNVGEMTDQQFKTFASNYNSSTYDIIKGTGTLLHSNAYNYCPHLQAVINKKAQAITIGKLIAVDKDEKPIQSAAFDAAMKVLKRPNKYQTKNQFLRTLETFLQVYGVVYFYKIIPDGYENLTGLIIIPNNCITVTYNKPTNVFENKNDLVKSYQVSIFGKTFLFQNETLSKIYEIRDTTENLSYGHEFEPKSRIDALIAPITNLVGSLESRNHLIVKRGADSLLSPVPNKDGTGANMPLLPTEKEALQKAYENYGLLNKQFHTLIPDIPLNYTKMGMNVKEMGLFEGENQDYITVAQAYNIPEPLLGIPNSTKYNTYKEAKTEFFENISIESEIISQGFDELFNAEKFGYRFYFDYSYLECMQRSNKEKSESLKITVEALNAALGTGLIEQSDAKNIIDDFIK
jgi:hypothetical protein